MKSKTNSGAAHQRLNLIPHHPHEMPTLDALRARRVLSRVAVSEALAREIGALAFTSADRWGARA